MTTARNGFRYRKTFYFVSGNAGKTWANPSLQDESVMDAEEPLLSVLVVNIDYKLHLDRSQFNGTKRKFGGQQAQPVYVPTIRVFGSTDAGQRACTHIHGVNSNYIPIFDCLLKLIVEVPSV
jgi:hypothetical protein